MEQDLTAFKSTPKEKVGQLQDSMKSRKEQKNNKKLEETTSGSWQEFYQGAEVSHELRSCSK